MTLLRTGNELAHTSQNDTCDTWYHGDCIEITEEEADLLEKFYCDAC